MYAILKSSKFVPCPDGENPETFRIYEVLEAGSIPVLVKTSENKEFVDYLISNMPLKVFDDWEDAACLVENMSENINKYTSYRLKVLFAWANFKEKIQKDSQILFNLV